MMAPMHINTSIVVKDILGALKVRICHISPQKKRGNKGGNRRPRKIEERGRERERKRERERESVMGC